MRNLTKLVFFTALFFLAAFMFASDPPIRVAPKQYEAKLPAAPEVTENSNLIPTIKLVKLLSVDDYLYVLDANKLRVLDEKSYKLRGEVVLERTPLEMAYFNGKIYVITHSSRSISVINTITLKKTEIRFDEECPGTPALLEVDEKGQLYVLLDDYESIALVNLKTNRTYCLKARDRVATLFIKANPSLSQLYLGEERALKVLRIENGILSPIQSLDFSSKLVALEVDSGANELYALIRDDDKEELIGYAAQELSLFEYGRVTVGPARESKKTSGILKGKDTNLYIATDDHLVIVDALFSRLQKVQVSDPFRLTHNPELGRVYFGSYLQYVGYIPDNFRAFVPYINGFNGSQ